MCAAYQASRCQSICSSSTLLLLSIPGLDPTLQGSDHLLVYLFDRFWLLDLPLLDVLVCQAILVPVMRSIGDSGGSEERSEGQSQVNSFAQSVLLTTRKESAAYCAELPQLQTYPNEA